MQPATTALNLKAKADPLDIDDDVSDDGNEVANQLRELDGANKYLQKIQIPTSKFIIYLIKHCRKHGR